jgi:predicted amidophosphoribosyltransferase
LRSWAEFEGPLRKALHKLKYESDLELGYIFFLPLIEIIQNNQWDLDLIIPMPISKEHKKTRGYNQSVAISRPIAIALNKSLV